MKIIDIGIFSGYRLNIFLRFYCVYKKKLYLCIRNRERLLQEQIGVVVQLVRIPACHAGGRGFESRPYRQSLFAIKRAFLQLRRKAFFILQSVVNIFIVSLFLSFC